MPVYETSSAGQVEWIMSNSGAKAIFVESAAHEAIVSGLRDRLTAVEHVWRIEGAEEGEGKAPGLDALRAEGTSVGDDVVAERATAAGAADLATIIYTSGTTGRPKGCELTHGNLLADVRNAVAGSLSGIFEIAGGSTMLFLPLAHSFARIIQVGCLESGAILGTGRTAGIPCWRSSGLPPDLPARHPDVFEKVYNSAEPAPTRPGPRSSSAAADIAVATQVPTRAAAPGPGAVCGPGTRCCPLVYAGLRPALGGKVQYAICGGSPLVGPLGRFFRGGGISPLEGYGLTETTAAATVTRPSQHQDRDGRPAHAGH